MAVKEVDESELLQMQGVVATLRKINADPKARRLLEQAQKAINPEMTTPGDYQDEVLKKFDELKADLDKREADRAKKDQERDDEAKKKTFLDAWQKQQASVRENYPWLNDEGVKAIETLAQERGIPDFEAAAALWVRDHPAPTPANPSGISTMNLFDVPTPEDDRAKFMDTLMQSPNGENARTEDSYIRQILAEERGQLPRKAA